MTITRLHLDFYKHKELTPVNIHFSVDEKREKELFLCSVGLKEVQTKQDVVSKHAFAHIRFSV